MKTPENKNPTLETDNDTLPAREAERASRQIIRTEVLRSDENISAGQDLYKILDESLQIDSLRERKAEVEKELLSDDIDSICKAVARFHELDKESLAKWRNGDSDGVALINEEQRKLQQEIENNPNYDRYLQLQKEQRSFRDLEYEYAPTYTIDFDDPLAINVLEKIINSTKNSETSHVSAPFSHYKENSGSKDENPAWKMVYVDDAKKHLDEKPFVSTRGMDFDIDERGVELCIKGSDEDRIDIPLSAIVSAAGFESWRGRREGVEKSWKTEFGSGVMGSLAVMMQYASLNTPLPPVGEIRVFVQPNGVVFADNGSGDSHRIAAAYLRGDKSVKAESVAVRTVPNGTLERLSLRQRYIV